MIIKIGNAVFSTDGDYPVMLILSPEEKKIIGTMKDEDDRICFVPTEWDDEKTEEWMSKL